MYLPIIIAHHQSVPGLISVESKLCAARPLELYNPQHYHVILLIERVVSANEEELPVLLLCMLLPQETHHVNYPLYYRLHATAQFLRHTSLLRLLSTHLEYTLSHNPPLGLSHAHWPQSRMFFQSD